MNFWQWFWKKYHRHEWEVYQEMPLRVYNGPRIGDDSNLAMKGICYVLKCKICGELKHKDMWP